MFTILLYLALPVVFLIHDSEEILMRKKCMSKIVKVVARKFPKLQPVVEHLQNLSTKQFSIIVIEELLIIMLSVVLFLNFKMPYIMYALFWGYAIHSVIHIFQALAIRTYIPGLISSIIFLPYCIFGAIDLIYQYGIITNIYLLISGFVFVALNLLVMHSIISK